MRRLRIGLTGGIASGKSTVARRFADLGVPVIDADDSARRVVAPGTHGLVEVVRRFGVDVLTPDGDLDRKALRKLVFSDSQRRRELESILHPLIRADMDSRSEAATGPYLVMAIPLLIEVGNLDRVDRILVIDLPETIQMERVTARDGDDPEQVRAILGAQISREKRLKAADDVLSNSGTLLELQAGVDQLHARYLKLAEERHSFNSFQGLP